MKSLNHIAPRRFRLTIKGGIVAAALFLGGCTEKTWPDLGPISYEPVVMMSEVARGGEQATHNAYPKDSSFGVWVMALEEHLLWKFDHKFADTVVDNEIVGWNGTEWNTAVPYDWPAEKTLTVAAYSPANVEAEFSAKSGVAFSNVDALDEDSKELMYAGPVCDKTYGAGSGSVNLPFRHALCSVQFAVIPHLPEHIDVKVRHISVEQLYHKGSFTSLPYPSWSVTGDCYTQVFFEGEEVVLAGETELLDSPKWLLPQITKVKVKLVCDFLYKEATLPEQSFEIEKNVAWEAGMTYSYTLKIYTDNIGFLHDNISGFIAE